MSNSLIPVTILTGFLGSGKTTLLNRILREAHGLRIAVIENEFGELGIDDTLVANAKDGLFEMNNGCICCTVRHDLTRILTKLIDRKDAFDYLLVETTGLADPAPVAQVFFSDPVFKEHFTLDGIVTLIDAKHVEHHLNTNAQCQKQVRIANRLILNKVDLISASQQEALKQHLKLLNQLASIIPTEQAELPLSDVLNLEAFQAEETVDILLEQPAKHHHDTAIESIEFELEGTIKKSIFELWLGLFLQAKGHDLLRMKGVMALQGMKERFIVQGVHELVSYQASEPWNPDEPRVNKLVFIGRELDKAELEQGLKSCLTKAPSLMTTSTS